MKFVLKNQRMKKRNQSIFVKSSSSLLAPPVCSKTNENQNKTKDSVWLFLVVSVLIGARLILGILRLGSGTNSQSFEWFMDASGCV